MQDDLFRGAADVVAPWPHATPRQVLLAHQARKLPALPTAQDYWRAGNFDAVNLGLRPSPLRDMHGVPAEEWRRVCSILDRRGNEIPISLGWWASDLGRVFYDGWKAGKPEWPKIVTDPRSGHRSAQLGGNGPKQLVHRLVASAFAPWPWAGDEAEVRHLDGDPSNNRADNLIFGTPRDNYDDAVRHGTRPVRKISDAAAAVLLETMTMGETDAEAARRLGVAVSTVHAIRSGRARRHVAPHIPRRASRARTS